MSKIALASNADGTGTFTIASPNSNSDRTLNLPDNSGTVLTSASNITAQAMNGPAFRAYMPSPQTISGNTFTKLNFTAEVFDTNSNYDTSTSRFTPTVAGYYQITGSIYESTTAQLYIYKNGAADATGPYWTSVGFVVNGLVYLNGSTDYVEIYMFSNAITIGSPNVTTTQFSGALVRAA
jgi:hypothetical protein